MPECGGVVRAVLPTLSEERLFGASLQVIGGRFDSDEQHVPVDMFAGGGGAPAREGLLQQYEVGYLIDLRQKPVGKKTSTRSGHLPTEQLD